MAKTTVTFVCNNCGYESSKWLGRCPECGNWNTFQEFREAKQSKGSHFNVGSTSATPVSVGSIPVSSQIRISTGFAEFDRVLGGVETTQGIIPGSALLLSGDPGVGKSTLLLQVALNLAKAQKKVLYITGEESEMQVRMRAERIASSKELSTTSLFILSTTDVDAASEIALSFKPDLIIVDSVQTMESQDNPSFPGSIPQIRYATSKFISIAKTQNIPVFLVGHVTKEGIVAGPMLLSHMVDAVLYLEGEQISGTRLLRAYKNRFGDTSEVGIFLMDEKGLKEASDVEGLFMNKRDEQVPGSTVFVLMEGSRPLLVEVQALIVPSSLTFPRRVTSGINERRLELLLAVLQKHIKIPVERLDVFVNVVGGLKITDTAIDLACCLSIISSFKGKSLPSTAAISEVGLLGELKKVVNLKKRVSEAKKFKFETVITGETHRYLADVVRDIG